MTPTLFLVLGVVGYISAISFPEGSTNRLTNGSIAADQQFEYVISLQQISELPNYIQAHKCGGVMISLQHALSLASCFYNVNNGVQVPLPASQFRVFAGAALLSADSSDRSRNVANFTIHPEHITYPSSINDIAVITLVQPFSNRTVFPLPLPPVNYIPDDFTLCILAGWGAPNSTVTASNELRYTTKFIYNNDTCTMLWNANSLTANVLPSMLCAASFNIISSGCHGDQGNALVCNNQLTGLLFLTNTCQISSYPEVYTRISNYIPWIRNITGAASSFKPEFGVVVLVTLVCIKIFS